MDTTTLAIIIGLSLLSFFVGWILYHITVWTYEYFHGPCFRGPLSEYKWPNKMVEERGHWAVVTAEMFFRQIE